MHVKNIPTLILASSSQGRATILTQHGVAFSIDPANIDEASYQEDSAEKLVQRLALEKAKVTAARHKQEYVLAADTVIVVDNAGKEQILGKPNDAAHAIKLLTLLSEKTHRVMTGLCLYNPHSSEKLAYQVACETTFVTFNALSHSDIQAYVQTGEPLGKSGAYAIQGLGRKLIKDIQGNEDNVVGLPLQLLYTLL